jgi:hypothetical protein
MLSTSSRCRLCRVYHRDIKQDSVLYYITNKTWKTIYSWETFETQNRVQPLRDRLIIMKQSVAHKRKLTTCLVAEDLDNFSSDGSWFKIPVNIKKSLS